MDYTIKQIADNVGVSKTAVMKKIANLGLQSKLAKNANRFVVDEETANKVISAFEEKTTTDEVCDKFANENANDLRKVVDILERELEEKNRQIEALTETIKAQAQSINAIEHNELAENLKQKMISDGSEESKEHWWQFWRK